VDKGSENDLGAVCLRESHPQDEDEFEGIVECCDMLADEHNRIDRPNVRNQ
jgi:hypothetical protein